eukprot:gene14261-16833_t
MIVEGGSDGVMQSSILLSQSHDEEGSGRQRPQSYGKLAKDDSEMEEIQITQDQAASAQAAQSRTPWWCWVLLISALLAMSSSGPALMTFKDPPPIKKASWRLQSTSLILFVGFLFDLHTIYPLLDVQLARWFVVRLPSAFVSMLPAGARDVLAGIEKQPYESITDRRSAQAEIRARYFSRRTFTILVLTGIALGLHFGFWVTSLNKTSLSHSLLFVTSNPIMIVIVMLVMRKPISKGEVIGCFIGFLGLVITLFDSLFLHAETTGVKPTVFGDFLALLGAVCIVFYLFAGQNLRSWLSLYLYAFPVTFTGSILLSIGSAIFEDNPIPKEGQSFGVFGWMSPGFIWITLYVAFFPGIIGHTGVNAIIKYVEPVVISVTLLLEPPIGVLMGWMVGIGGMPGIFTYIGGPIVMLGCGGSTDKVIVMEQMSDQKALLSQDNTDFTKWTAQGQKRLLRFIRTHHTAAVLRVSYIRIGTLEQHTDKSLPSRDNTTNGCTKEDHPLSTTPTGTPTDRVQKDTTSSISNETTGPIKMAIIKETTDSEMKDIPTSTTTTTTTQQHGNNGNHNNNNNNNNTNSPLGNLHILPPKRPYQRKRDAESSSDLEEQSESEEEGSDGEPASEEEQDAEDDAEDIDSKPADEGTPTNLPKKRGAAALTSQGKVDIESPQSRASRQTKRPRKYLDDEEDPDNLGAISTTTTTTTTAAGTASGSINNNNNTSLTSGINGGAIQATDKSGKAPIGRPKRAASTDTDTPMGDTSNDNIEVLDSAGPSGGPEDKKKKYKSKKAQPNNLDAPSLPPQIRPCWFAGCTKADRSLKILRPCLVPTCKTHAIKSESRIYESLGKGFCLEENGQKDTVCGICGEGNKTLAHCSMDNCAFAYCDACIDIIANKHGQRPNGPKWVCWVCNAVKIRCKERERTRWVREIVQPNAYQAMQPRKARAPKYTDQPPGGGSSTTTTTTTSGALDASGNPVGKRGRKAKASTPDYEINKRGRKKDYLDGGYEVSAPGSPINESSDVSPGGTFTYHSILSPERDPVSPIDFFIDQSFNSIKFFSSLLSQQPSEDAHEVFGNMVHTISRLRTIRWSNDYTMVWRAIEELGALLRRNLQSSQTIVAMQGEIAAMDEKVIRTTNSLTRNQPLERAISRVFEHHELSSLIERECTATRNVLVIAIDAAHKTIEELHQNFDIAVKRDKGTELRTNRELFELDDQMKATVNEIQMLKHQEDELVESLSKVRSSLSTFDAMRDSLIKRCSDLKIEALLSRNGIAEREMDIRVKQATLENEIGALNALITLIEGVYWGHEYFYGSEIGECEKAIGQKLLEVNDKINIISNDIPLALSLKDGVPKAVGGSVVSLNSEENSVSFLNPFKTLCIYHTQCMDHNVPDYHLEKPDRIRVAINTINDFATKYPGIVEVYNTPPEVEQRYVMAVHDAHYIRKLETSLPPENSNYETHLESDNTGATITVTQKEDDDDQEIYDTFVSHRSMKAALRAAGAVCAAVDAVSKLGYHRTFCAIRPPGHHAGRFGRTNDAPSQGYCLINNVAIGAKYASFTGGYTRIAVVDFDVHHGNGTEEILSGDDNFLFVSIHVCDEKRYFYPGTGKDAGDQQDDGSYQSNVLNIGLKRNSGSATFLQAWTKKIIPRLEAYQPQLIFLSAGFDGHKDDPTNGLKLTEDDYFTVTKMIKQVAAKYSRGRIISVLEGGYGIEKSNSLQRCLNMHLKALVEDSNNEILFSQAGVGDFGLIKKIYNGTSNSTIREPSKQGDNENIALYNNIAKEYNETAKAALAAAAIAAASPSPSNPTTPIIQPSISSTGAPVAKPVSSLPPTTSNSSGAAPSPLVIGAASTHTPITQPIGSVVKPTSVTVPATTTTTSNITTPSISTTTFGDHEQLFQSTKYNGSTQKQNTNASSTTTTSSSSSSLPTHSNAAVEISSSPAQTPDPQSPK